MDLRSIGNSKLLAMIRAVRSARTTSSQRPVLAFFGYDPRTILRVTVARLFAHAMTVAYVFDKHGIAIRLKRPARRALLDTYFRLVSGCFPSLGDLLWSILAPWMNSDTPRAGQS